MLDFSKNTVCREEVRFNVLNIMNVNKRPSEIQFQNSKYFIRGCKQNTFCHSYAMFYYIFQNIEIFSQSQKFDYLTSLSHLTGIFCRQSPVTFKSIVQKIQENADH